MKKTLYIILVILAGFGVGFVVGEVIIHFTKGSVGGIDMIKLLKALVASFVALVVGTFANIILHEAGHLVGGLLTGFKFLSFRICNLTLQKEDDGWHWKKYSIMGSMGQCLMCPPHTEMIPYFWYNAGGVIANLIICIVSAALLYFFDLSMIPFVLCVMLFAIGVGIFIMNAIPMTVSGVPNDGKNILTLWRHPEQRKHFHNMLAVAAEQSRGKRVSEMPNEWFESVPITKDSTIVEISSRNLHYARLMDEMRFDEAREIAEELMEQNESLPQLFQIEVSCDLLLLELVTINRIEVVNELWNKKFKVGNMTLQKYIMQYRKHLPMKCAILFAYEYINNQSLEAAQTYYDEVESNFHSYMQPGEARMALAVMDKIKAM